MEYKDYYKILGISSYANDKAINRVYCQLARQSHPDKNPGTIETENTGRNPVEACQLPGESDICSIYICLGPMNLCCCKMGGAVTIPQGGWLLCSRSVGMPYQRDISEQSDLWVRYIINVAQKLIEKQRALIWQKKDFRGEAA